ncbi:MAG: hypothetical protein ABIO92_00520 [Chloroflexia bacterium]
MVATTRIELTIFDTMRGRYPHTVAAFESMPNGERALQAVTNLQDQWVRLNSNRPVESPFSHVPTVHSLPSCRPENRFDIVIAGGGLGLIAGVALARRGLRVLVFDRDRVGAAHREWNISERELKSLSQWGLFTHDEIEQTIAAHYSRGVISFDARGTGVEACPLQLEGVLDVALDAQSVLDKAREHFVEVGGTIKEGRSFKCLHMANSGRVASVFEIDGPNGTEYYSARLAIDTMGSVSPIALGLNDGLPFDGVCPTAGTVMEGLESDPATGDVLVSVAPAQDGRQLIWEGFPGNGGDTTVYLFYYDRTGSRYASNQGLLDLFERYFTLLPTYRRLNSAHRHLRPVFGYIPARHGRTGQTAARGLICLGDSAAGQSPLTFCGFGSFVRHIGRVSLLLEYALRKDLLEEWHLRLISPHQANLRVAWVFSRFMQPWPGSDPAAVNRIMNVFCSALGKVGQRTTLRFLQDRYTFAEYISIMLTTARHYPHIFAITARVLGPSGLAKWAVDIVLFAASDLVRTLQPRISRRLWRRLERNATRRMPALALRLISVRTLFSSLD